MLISILDSPLLTLKYAKMYISKHTCLAELCVCTEYTFIHLYAENHILRVPYTITNVVKIATNNIKLCLRSIQ